MASQIIALERRELYAYCENLPAPIIARPVVIASLGRGMALALDCDGQRVTLQRVLQDGDRIDLCSPLLVDPMTARRLRAAASKPRR